MFDAIVLTQGGAFDASRADRLDESQLPAGEVNVRIAYSTLNYKDALAITGHGASHEAAYLRFLGATTIVDRNELSAPGRIVKQVSVPLHRRYRSRTGRPLNGRRARGNPLRAMPFAACPAHQLRPLPLKIWEKPKEEWNL